PDRLRALDAQTTRNGGMFNMRNVTGPMRTVMLDPTLRSLAMTGFILSLVHSAWLVYLPTYLSVEIGIPPIVSGYIFAVLQTGAFLGRLMLGWGADKILTPRSVLVWALIGTAVTTCILPAIAPYSNGLVLGILALITGIAAAGWSGVQVAEVMRLAKPDSLIDAAS